MEYIFQLIVSGFLEGGLYSLLALGFVLVYKATRIINFATGQLLLVGAFICWVFISIFGLLLGLAFGITGSIILAVIVEKMTIRPLIGQPLIAVIMMTIALSVLFDGVIISLWTGVGAKVYPTYISREPFQYGDFMISRQLVFSFSAAAFFFGMFYLYFKHTRMGLRMRAVAENQQAAQACGIEVKRVFRMVWIFAFLIGTIGGFLVGSMVGVQPVMTTIGLKVFPVVILGGLESIIGCLIAGPIVGIAVSLGVGYLGPILGISGLDEIIPYLVIFIVLFIKPYGLFGETRIERV